MKTIQEWLDYMYAIEKDNAIGSLSEIAGLTISSSQSGDLSFVDELLEKFDVDKAESLTCVAFCRYTFSMNQFLKNWFNYRDRCFSKMVKVEGEEKAKKVMRGLMENKVYQPMFPDVEKYIFGVHPSLTEQRQKNK
jgi:hypothetical protein